MEATRTLDTRDVLLSHREFVRTLARRLVSDPNEAEDIEQEALLTALDRPPQERANLRPWLARVTERIAFTRRRSRARSNARERKAARREAIEPEPSRALELRQRVVESVLALPAAQREVVVLRYEHGQSLREIAARQEVSIETARTRLRRAHERLREGLAAREGSDWRASLIVMLADTDSAALSAGAHAPIAVPVQVAAAVAALAVLGGALQMASSDSSKTDTPIERAPIVGLDAPGGRSEPANAEPAGISHAVNRAPNRRQAISGGPGVPRSGPLVSGASAVANEWEPMPAFVLSDHIPAEDLALLDRLRLQSVTAARFPAGEDLETVIDQLAELCSIPTQIDDHALSNSEARALHDLPITHPMSVAALLDHLLRRNGDDLAWTVREGRVLITDEEHAPRAPMLFRHGVGDLVHIPIDGLAMRVQDCFAFDEWARTGVSIDTLDNTILVIVQAPEVQARVQEFLDRLRINLQPFEGMARDPLQVWPPPDARNQELERRLDEAAITSGFGSTGTSAELPSMADALSTALDANVLLDRRALELAAQPGFAIHLDPATRTPREFLEAIDASSHLGWYVDRGMLVIAVQDDISGRGLATVIHDVGRLLRRAASYEGGVPFNASLLDPPHAREYAPVDTKDSLDRLIRYGIAYASWDEDPGFSVAIDTHAFLWISQRPTVLRRVGALLGDLERRAERGQ